MDWIDVAEWAGRLRAHEEVAPERVARMVAELRERGEQETPLLVIKDTPGEGEWMIADGHHRWAALKMLAKERRVRASVRELKGDWQLRPAHRVVYSAPDDWLERLRAGLASRLHRGERGVELRSASGVEEFGGPGLMRALWRAAALDECGCEWSIEGDASKAVEELERGAVAVILAPVIEFGAVMEAAGKGPLLPPRSTNFQPKPEKLAAPWRIWSD